MRNKKTVVKVLSTFVYDHCFNETARRGAKNIKEGKDLTITQISAIQVFLTDNGTPEMRKFSEKHLQGMKQCGLINKNVLN